VIPGLSVIWVILFVLLLALALDRLLFKPLTRVMGERETRVKSAIELANQAAARAKAATAEFEQRTQAAQGEVYREMDETRRAALERRQELLGQTRRDVDASVAEARARVADQAATARARLEQESAALADAVATRVLGREVSR